MIKVLEGATIEDLRTFEKAAFILSAKGYGDGDYKKITAELVDIIRLRGLYDKQPRWRPTIDVVFKSYVAFNGVVTPKDIDIFLRKFRPWPRRFQMTACST